MKKKILYIITVLILIGISGYCYIMFGGARDLASETTAYTVSSKSITDEFTADLENSNKKYLEKPVAISGTVTSVNDTIITLNHTVICALKLPIKNIKINQQITIKGRVVGYDDLMEELKLDQCFIIK